MAERRLNIGIVGAGRMGITHYAILNPHPRVVVKAVADTSALVNSLLAKYAGVSTYADYGQMLEAERLDAVLVCTPPSLNAEILGHAVSRGIHAFVEKPFMTDSALGLRIAGSYEDAHLVNQVGYVNRFNDMFVRAKQLIEAGVVGTVVRFRSEMYSRTVIRKEEGGGWRSSRASGGGVTYEMAAHAIDLIGFLFGRPETVVGTTMSRVFSSAVEDIVSSSFIYGNGTVGSLNVNWSDPSYRKPTNRIEVFGDHGRLVVDQHGMKVYVNEADARRGFKAGWNSVYITDVFSSVRFFVRGIEFTAQLHDFVECVLTGARSRCTFRDACDVLAVIDEMFADADRNGGIQSP